MIPLQVPCPLCRTALHLLHAQPRLRPVKGTTETYTVARPPPGALYGSSPALDSK